MKKRYKNLLLDIKICEYCNKKFKVIKNNFQQKYCSEKCWKKAKGMIK